MKGGEEAVEVEGADDDEVDEDDEDVEDRRRRLIACSGSSAAAQMVDEGQQRWLLWHDHCAPATIAAPTRRRAIMTDGCSLV